VSGWSSPALGVVEAGALEVMQAAPYCRLAEQNGIVFIDEIGGWGVGGECGGTVLSRGRRALLLGHLHATAARPSSPPPDKIISNKSKHSGDASAEGVQRDLLPLIEVGRVAAQQQRLLFLLLLHPGLYGAACR
jgi:hypothetical protein